jgi:hypothetical protein
VRILSELQRRRKDNRLIVGLTLAVLVVWSVVSALEQRANEMEPATITRGLLLFVLSYINITLIAAVLFVLGRTLIKTWLERRRRALGSQFRTKLLVTYVVLTAIPIGLLFFTATGLLQRSIDRWFSSPVREVVDRARRVEDMAEKRITDEALQAARSLATRPAAARSPAALDSFRREHRLDSVELYGPAGRLLVDSARPAELAPLPAETLRRARETGEESKIEVLPDGSHRYRAARRQGECQRQAPVGHPRPSVGTRYGRRHGRKRRLLGEP